MVVYFRALQFVHTFFSCVLEDSQEGKKSEDLVPFLKKAYKETLEAYHGWMTQKLFGVSVNLSHRYMKCLFSCLMLVYIALPSVIFFSVLVPSATHQIFRICTSR
jgi:hypothetical protein